MTAAASFIYLDCPKCGRRIRATVPKSGDGSALRVRKHNRKRPYSRVARMNTPVERCGFSWRMVDWSGHEQAR